MMKKTLLTIAAVLAGCALLASTPQRKYIEKWAVTACEEMQRSGVPASITLAQGLLESDAGRSELAVKSNNHFGIKCHSDWQGGTVTHRAEKGKECFRAYKSAEDSFRDHSDFLSSQDRYRSLFDLAPTDYEGWARGLKEAGYATDKRYPEKLIRVIREYGLQSYDLAIASTRRKSSRSAAQAARSAAASSGAAASSAAPVQAEVPSREEVKSPDIPEGKYKEEQVFQAARPAGSVNGVPCIYALDGETFDSIARANDLFLKEILKYNDLDSPVVLHTGDVVYLSFKKARVSKGTDTFVVGPGQQCTLWDVSQRYGVRLSWLKKLNRGCPEILREGNSVVLRK